MNTQYIQEQIAEELRRSYEYIKLAIETKQTEPNWADMCYKLSRDKVKFANNLIELYEEKLEVASSEARTQAESVRQAEVDKTEFYEETLPKRKEVELLTKAYLS